MEERWWRGGDAGGEKKGFREREVVLSRGGMHGGSVYCGSLFETLLKKFLLGGPLIANDGSEFRGSCVDDAFSISLSLSCPCFVRLKEDGLYTGYYQGTSGESLFICTICWSTS